MCRVSPQHACAAQGSCMVKQEPLQEGAHGSSSFVCVHRGLERQHCQPKDSTVPSVGHPGSTHGGKFPGSSEMRGSSANPILNPTGAPQLWDASTAAAPISCSLRGAVLGWWLLSLSPW